MDRFLDLHRDCHVGRWLISGRRRCSSPDLRQQDRWLEREVLGYFAILRVKSPTLRQFPGQLRSIWTIALDRESQPEFGPWRALVCAMANIQDARASRSRLVSILLLIFVFLFASTACAAMPPTMPGCEHPCCPKPPHTTPDPCAQAGCISSVAAIEPVLVAGPVLLRADSICEPARPSVETCVDRVSDAAPCRDLQLFLQHRQFLI